MKTIALSMESFLLLRMRDPAIPGPYVSSFALQCYDLIQLNGDSQRAFQLHEPYVQFLLPLRFEVSNGIPEYSASASGVSFVRSVPV